MIGYPGESLADIETTMRYAVRLPLDWANFTITQPHPGTQIYAEGVKECRFPKD